MIMNKDQCTWPSGIHTYTKGKCTRCGDTVTSTVEPKVDVKAWAKVASIVDLAVVSSPSGTLTIFNRQARERGFLMINSEEVRGSTDDGRLTQMTPLEGYILMGMLAREVG